jgi:hypothetical protein
VTIAILQQIQKEKKLNKEDKKEDKSAAQKVNDKELGIERISAGKWAILTEKGQT